MKIQAAVHKRSDAASAPAYATARSAGFDLAASEDVTIGPGEVAAVPTGLVVGCPPGYFLLLAARSSLAVRKHLILANGVGIVDPDYCGADDEVKALLLNVGPDPVTVQKGERVAQGLFLPAVQAEFLAFQPADRSRGGFGSTGGYAGDAGGRASTGEVV